MGRAPIGEAWGVVESDGEFWRARRFLVWWNPYGVGELARSVVCVVGQVEQIGCILSRARLGQWDERQPG